MATKFVTAVFASVGYFSAGFAAGSTVMNFLVPNLGLPAEINYPVVVGVAILASVAGVVREMRRMDREEKHLQAELEDKRKLEARSKEISNEQFLELVNTKVAVLINHIANTPELKEAILSDNRIGGGLLRRRAGENSNHESSEKKRYTPEPASSSPKYYAAVEIKDNDNDHGVLPETKSSIMYSQSSPAEFACEDLGGVKLTPAPLLGQRTHTSPAAINSRLIYADEEQIVPAPTSYSFRRSYTSMMSSALHAHPEGSHEGTPEQQSNRLAQNNNSEALSSNSLVTNNEGSILYNATPTQDSRHMASSSTHNSHPLHDFYPTPGSSSRNLGRSPYTTQKSKRTVVAPSNSTNEFLPFPQFGRPSVSSPAINSSPLGNLSVVRKKGVKSTSDIHADDDIEYKRGGPGS